MTIASDLSHPTGVRGLKFEHCLTAESFDLVAPHWGAWIEIYAPLADRVKAIVAPHWGAWIEI